MTAVLFQAVTLSLVAAQHASGQVILHPPSDVTLFLDQTAVFECEVDDGIAGWKVNGSLISDLGDTLRDDVDSDRNPTEAGTLELTLTITGRAEYTGLPVQCVVVDLEGNSDESDIVTMNVQGLLSAVGDLEINSDASSITISWTAPYSLDVTGVDPDIWYSVLIYNVTDDEPTLISHTDCINITDTHYTFTPDSPSPCHQYIFTLLPVNGAGQGETSQNVTGYTIDGDFKVEFVRVSIAAISTEECDVTFQVCGELEEENTYTFFGATGLNEVIISERNKLLLQSRGFLTFTLPANKTYSSYYITVGTENIPSNDKFTTYDIHNFTAIGNGGRITVTGKFINNTFATGCFIVIQNNSRATDTYRALLLPDSEQTVSEVISVPPSIYTVYAYDLEVNALPNPLPAVTSGSPINIKSKYAMHEFSSEFLSSATISQNGWEVFITCQFNNVYSESSCVLVYREYGNTTLTVIEYPHSTEFPVNVTVDNPQRYTFAVFGKSGTDIESEPVIAVRLEAIKTPPTAISFDDTTDKQASVSGVVTGVMVAVIAALATAVVAVSAVVVYRSYRKRKKVARSDSSPSPSSTTNIYTSRADGDTLKSAEAAFDIRVESSGVRVEASYVTVSHTPGVCPRPSMTPRINYEDINHKATQELADHIREENANKKEPDKKTEPQKKPVVAPTVETVMDLLYDIRGHWKEIADGLGFDEDMIDEIFTNNEMDEACLMNCIEIWVQRLGPTWEKLSHALANMGENKLAHKACPSAAHDSGDSKGQGDDGSCVASSEVSGDDSGVSDVVSGHSGHQTPATSHDDANRGHKIQVPLPDEYKVEEQYMVQTTLQDPYDMSANEVDDVIISESEEENDDTKSELPSCVECSSGDEDDDLTVMLGSTAHHLSSHHMNRGSDCFEQPPVPQSRNFPLDYEDLIQPSPLDNIDSGPMSVLPQPCSNNSTVQDQGPNEVIPDTQLQEPPQMPLKPQNILPQPERRQHSCRNAPNKTYQEQHCNNHPEPADTHLKVQDLSSCAGNSEYG